MSEENSNSKRFMLTCAHSSTIRNSQDMETNSVSTDRWVDKEDTVHRCNGILLSHKKEWDNAICSSMDGPRDYHTKWSTSEKEWHIPHLCVDYKIWHKWTYLGNGNRLTDIKTDLWLSRGGAGGDRLTPAEAKCYRGWTNTRALSCSTADYRQHSMTDHNGKEHNIKRTHVYIIYTTELCNI